MRALILSLPVLAGILSVSVAQAQNPVVAIVNGDPIYLEDVRQAALSLPAELSQLPFAMVFDRVLDRLIDVRLIAQAGRSEGLAQDPEVEARLRGLTDRVIQEVRLTRKVESTGLGAVLHRLHRLLVFTCAASPSSVSISPVVPWAIKRFSRLSATTVMLGAHGFWISSLALG